MIKIKYFYSIEKMPLVVAAIHPWSPLLPTPFIEIISNK